jgi:hypothetical protein
MKHWSLHRIVLSFYGFCCPALLKSVKACLAISCLSCYTVHNFSIAVCLTSCTSYYYIVELLHFSHFHHVSLVQWNNHLLPPTGDSSLHPGGATHTLELGLPVSAVLLQWWPRRDPWSPAMIGLLILATGCFSHPSCPSSILIGGHRLMRHTARIL